MCVPSDAILDAHLAQDPEAKVACETVTKTGMVMVRNLAIFVGGVGGGGDIERELKALHESGCLI